MANAVLLVAFHFPPASMGSGHLRALGFARYLPASGWKPIVLSARALAYPRTAQTANGLIPPDCVVHRAFALDASRHLAIAGRYPGFLAQPDRWASWWPAAVASGLRLIRRHHVKAIWSTYPIMTAHHIGYTLSRLARLPWIADFRDPVATSVEPGNPWSFASQHRWERLVLRDATRIVLTTPGALRAYAQQYPDAYTEGRLALIGNGYDEAAFANLPKPRPGSQDRPLVLVHSGLLYADGRNPLAFFTALAHLKKSGVLTAHNIQIVLRASGSDATYANDLARLNIADMVALAGPVPNRAALEEQARADALLLFQGTRFDRQIPAKLYEYLRIGRPILALVSMGGDTAAALRDAGGATLLPIDDARAIAEALPDFVARYRAGTLATVGQNIVQRYSRENGAHALAQLLRQAVDLCG